MNQAYWIAEAKKHLEGKKIVAVRYITKKEAEGLGWDRASVVLQLDDGSVWFPSSDDEGNDAGALFGQIGKDSVTLPVLFV